MLCLYLPRLWASRLQICCEDMELEELVADERRKPGDLRPIIEALIVGESPKYLAASV